MTNKHTPGPWEIYLGIEGYGIKGICGSYYGDIENEADARLIAAAPELLEELRWMRKHWRKNENDPQGAVLQNTNGEAVRNWIDRVDAVMAKVEGSQA